MKRKHKLYSRPKQPFNKFRIEEERKIMEEYGLKNKKEIWKAESKIKSMREKAKKLIKSSKNEQKALIDKINKMGLKVSSIENILSLNSRDYLERRLQTIIFKKGLVSSIKGARQKITHKKVLVDGKIVNIPSYIVFKEMENKISLK